MIVSSNTQGPRTDMSSYNIDQLFADLLEELKRLASLNKSYDTAMLTSIGGKQNQRYHSVLKNKYMIQKSKYCQKCKRNNHNTSECFILKKKNKKQLQSQVQNNNEGLIDFNPTNFDFEWDSSRSL
ncbi:hypothetical protein GcM1_156011 [Golovinomyces cichoracearum]|uniref:Uncharacterized protein n=1 Tax=Golovinomyces cichoracearum TaxID=62708 RepID=A0A420JA55_9PEZI|nr:hypothetical protein GcM1_156011 [Golovinomyces cichoracearum]